MTAASASAVLSGTTPAGGQRSEHVQAGVAAPVQDNGFAAVGNPHQAGLLQPLERLAHRVPVDLQGQGQFAF